MRLKLLCEKFNQRLAIVINLFTVVLLKHSYIKSFIDKKKSTNAGIFSFGNCLNEQSLSKISVLPSLLFKRFYQLFFLNFPFPILYLFLSLFFSNLQSNGQCPSGTAPSGTNLVVNGNFSSGNTLFSSAYTYCNSSNCLYPESKYSIGTNANVFHSAFSGNDHTTGTGNFMIVNGAGTANTSTWCQSISVTPNSTYIFSVWVCSVHPSSPAKLQFSANGILLGGIFTAPSSTNLWVNFSAPWNSGSNTSVTVCIKNQNTIASGNDFGLDDIFFQKCCAPITANAGSNVALCFGQTSTTLNASGTGGVTPYTYLWNNVNPAQSIVVGSGVYTVKVSYPGCPPAYSTATVTSYSVAISANAGSDKTVCKQNPVTSLSGSIIGASGGIWSGGGGTFSPLNTTLSGVTYSPTTAELAAGFVDLTLTTTGNGTCAPGTDIVRINYVGFNGTVSFTQTPISCYGGNNATATVNVSGGTPTYTYSWNTAPAQSTPTISNLAIGTYSVTITNGLGCTSANSVTIGQPLPLALSSSITHVTCAGGSNGAISVTPTGGTSPYTYLWSNGNTTSQISNLTSQTYSLTVTDLKACQKTATFTINQPLPITVLLLPTAVNCFNGNNGSATSTVSGGTSPYTYNWSSGATSPNASGLQAGTFTLSVTDIAGCTGSNSTVITQPTALLSTATAINATCNYSNNGIATAGSSGGTPGYTYLWQPGGQTSTSINNLSGGTYTLTTTDLSGCTATAFATIAELSQLSINFISQSNVSCFGGNNGIVTANPSGGAPNYTYLWAPGGNTASTLSNLFAGTYTVTVTDSKGCIATNSVTISQPMAPLAVSTSSLPTTCFGGTNGSVSSTAINGTGSYTFIWMPGSLAGQNIPNLAAGTYTVTAKDSKGCIDTKSVTIDQPDQIVLSTTSVNSDCGQPNGQTSVSIVSGGNFPFNYLWSPTGGTNAAVAGLVSGAYTVTVTDLNGCTSTQFGNVGENAAPLLTISSVINVSCNGGANGSAKVSTTGGIGPFTYSWMPIGGNDSIATALTAGSYTVTVNGSNNCQSLATINPGITEPPPILITETSTPVTCFGGNDGTASVIASGGTQGYTYLWSNSGTSFQISNLSAQTYTIQVTDTNNCVQTKPVLITEPSKLNTVISSTTNVSCYGLSDGAATAAVSGGTMGYTYNWLPLGGNGPIGTGFPVGTYTLTITDFNGCIKQDSAVITQPAQALSATNTASNITCFGASNGTAGIHPVGGTVNYTYQWNPSASINDTASGLASGNYSILIADNNGCETNLAISITEPSEISGSLVSVDPSCGLSNGAISSQVSGGVLPYTYLWSFGGATTSGINGLGTGTYSLTVTDALGCSKILSTVLTIMPNPAISVSTINNVSCFGGNDGSATVTITMGTAPYTIDWSPSGGNSLTASVLSAGTYFMNVTDAIGCQTLDSLTIAEPTPVDVSISSITDVLCNGGSTGSISVAATGGTGPLYRYSWAPVASDSATAANLALGTYTVTVMDQNNCIKSISATIAEPTLLSASIDTTVHATCYGGVGSAAVLASGGVIPYSYSWSAPAIGQTGSEATNLIAGSYTVTITDIKGCFATAYVIIKEPLEVITSSGEDDTLCLGQTGTLTASAIGGAGNYYYAWQPSGAITLGTLPVTPSSDITYTVVAYDQLGCQGTPETVAVTVFNLTANNIQAQGASPICPGQNTTIYVETTGSTGPLTYQWNNNLGTESGNYLVTPAQPTTYIVTVSNMCGLSATDSVIILLNPQPSIALTSANNSLCVPGSMPFFDNSVTGNINDPITMWEWHFGDGTISAEENPVHFYSQPGTYLISLTVSTVGGCTSNNLSSPLMVTAHPIPSAVFSVNSSNLDLPYDVLILNNQSVGANSYYWEFGDSGTSTQFNPQYVYSSLGVFYVQLIAMSQYGCVDTAFAEITTDADVIFPNVFTPNPNGDQGGIYDINNLSNDIFFPYSSGVIEYKIEIFNRWGEEIFESLDIKQGWDGFYRGVICQQDVYVWKAYIKLNNGKVFYKNGDVTLLRY
ncbi:MAG: PKD domain-containing protein [Bacteroidota bacterium]